MAAHAHSYEAFEWASYEMLIRRAERAGDDTTAARARAVGDQERAMAERLAGAFDRAFEASPWARSAPAAEAVGAEK